MIINPNDYIIEQYNECTIEQYNECIIEQYSKCTIEQYNICIENANILEENSKIMNIYKS